MVIKTVVANAALGQRKQTHNNRYKHQTNTHHRNFPQNQTQCPKLDHSRSPSKA